MNPDPNSPPADGGDPSDGGGGSPGWVIPVAVILGILGAALCIFLAFIARRRYKNVQEERREAALRSEPLATHADVENGLQRAQGQQPVDLGLAPVNAKYPTGSSTHMSPVRLYKDDALPIGATAGALAAGAALGATAGGNDVAPVAPGDVHLQDGTGVSGPPQPSAPSLSAPLAVGAAGAGAEVGAPPASRSDPGLVTPQVAAAPGIVNTFVSHPPAYAPAGTAAAAGGALGLGATVSDRTNPLAPASPDRFSSASLNPISASGAGSMDSARSASLAAPSLQQHLTDGDTQHPLTSTLSSPLRSTYTYSYTNTTADSDKMQHANRHQAQQEQGQQQQPLQYEYDF